MAGRSVTIEFTTDELIMINNCLNEIGNGIDVDDAEFGTRLGFTREEVRTLLQRISDLIEAERQWLNKRPEAFR